MALETSSADEEIKEPLKKRRVMILPRILEVIEGLIFRSVSRRIVILNLAALAVLLSGILYMTQFREGLIDARIESLRIQGEIIAGAIAASATVETDSITVDLDRLLELQTGESLSPLDNYVEDFPINPEKVGPLLRRLITPTKTRARIYDQDGILILDSKHLYARGQVLRFDLPTPTQEGLSFTDRLENWFNYITRRTDLEIYRELSASNGRGYPEVARALNGRASTMVRVDESGGLIVSVALPVQRFRAVLGALFLSTEGEDIDAILQEERMQLVQLFLVAGSVIILLSILLAGTIAGPVSRLAYAAERVRRGVKSREEIPDYSKRPDEIGHLSGALRDMTTALYDRIEAIETFAADVAHELKNPLTSLRSAVETLPLAKTPEAEQRLREVIAHDVRRLDRLISDISDASRLDAELARAAAEKLDMEGLVHAVIEMRDAANTDQNVTIVPPEPLQKGTALVSGHGSRLAQVLSNLIDNAVSFSPKDGKVIVKLTLEKHHVLVSVEDEGPGIRKELLERIFERFYTDRPDEGFGNNSGLGLSISRQIIEAHEGQLFAGNRSHDPSAPLGAIFTIRLPRIG